MNLNLHTWKEFEMERLFDIKKGKRLTAADQEEGDTNYIGAIDSNNGVANHIGQKPIHSANTISLSYNGSVGEAFYQSEPYWATDDVNALYSYYEQFNKYIGLFMVAVIRQEKYKFSYGRKWTLDNMNKTKINLPIQHNSDGTLFIDADKKYSDDGYVPDWKFMEDYIKSLHYKPLTTEKKKGHSNELRVEKWKWFSLKGISNVYTGGDLILSIVDDGEIPVASHKVENNGVGALVDKIENRQLFDCKKTIALADRGCFHASVQTEDFYIGTRVKALEMKCCVSKGVLIFIATIINQETFKYSYGRNCTAGVENVRIKLPVQYNDDGTIFIDDEHTYSEEGYVPDWKFMEDYIKSLPYGDRL